MASNIETIIETAKDYANDVKKSLPVNRTVLFGSYSRGAAGITAATPRCP
jgi:predicted nucleotidyltransferase